MKKVINHPMLGGDKVDLRKPLPVPKKVEGQKSGRELLDEVGKVYNKDNGKKRS
jgi:hypothetical protein